MEGLAACQTLPPVHVTQTCVDVSRHPTIINMSAPTSPGTQGARVGSLKQLLVFLAVVAMIAVAWVGNTMLGASDVALPKGR